MNRLTRSFMPSLGLLAAVSGIACNEPPAELCDITQRSCQESIYLHVLSLRGDGFDPFGGLPPVTVITENDFRQQLIQQQAERAAKGGPDPWDNALLLLHFTTRTSPTNPDGGTGNSTIDDEATQVYAYYDPETKTVTIVSHPGQADDRVTPVTTLAHELVHSLQDREIDLQKSDLEDSDLYLAYHTLVEGDADFYTNLFTKDLCPSIPDCKRVKSPAMMLDLYLSNFDKLGAPLSAAKLLMYPLGAAYEDTEYQAGGNTAVRHGYAKKPLRTVGFLVGTDGVAPPVGPGYRCPASAVASLPKTGDSAGADQFGALLFYTFLRGWQVDKDVAFATARTWTGDFLRVQATSNLDTTAVAWRIELSGSPPATVVQALRATGELTVTAQNNALEITATDSVTPLTWQSAPGCR